MYAAWIFLMIILGLISCGGSENVIVSSTSNVENSTHTEDDTDPIRLFDGPTDPTNGGTGGSGGGGN